MYACAYTFRDTSMKRFLCVSCSLCFSLCLVFKAPLHYRVWLYFKDCKKIYLSLFESTLTALQQKKKPFRIFYQSTCSFKAPLLVNTKLTSNHMINLLCLTQFVVGWDTCLGFLVVWFSFLRNWQERESAVPHLFPVYVDLKMYWVENEMCHHEFERNDQEIKDD